MKTSLESAQIRKLRWTWLRILTILYRCWKGRMPLKKGQIRNYEERVWYEI